MLNLRALRDLIRDLAHPCRAADRVIDAHVAAALDPAPLPPEVAEWGGYPSDYGYRTGRAATLADLIYHGVVSEVGDSLRQLMPAAITLPDSSSSSATAQ